MGCNARCGVMHNVADISGAILNMVLQSESVLREVLVRYETAVRYGEE